VRLRLPVATTVVIALILAAWWAAAQVAASRKLGPLEPLPARGSYAITLDFAPERFHQQRLQDLGRLVEVRDRTVYMMDVTPGSARAIAGEYWVDRVARWEGR
jgi:hypothetical protein